MADWREKIFIPLVTRMAQKVLENMQTVKDLHWMILGLVLWNSLLTVVIFYKTLKYCIMNYITIKIIRKSRHKLLHPDYHKKILLLLKLVENL